MLLHFLNTCASVLFSTFSSTHHANKSSKHHAYQIFKHRNTYYSHFAVNRVVPPCLHLLKHFRIRPYLMDSPDALVFPPLPPSTSAKRVAFIHQQPMSSIHSHIRQPGSSQPTAPTSAPLSEIHYNVSIHRPHELCKSNKVSTVNDVPPVVRVQLGLLDDNVLDDTTNLQTWTSAYLVQSLVHDKPLKKR